MEIRRKEENKEKGKEERTDSATSAFVNGAKDVQQRRLAASRGPSEHHEFASIDIRPLQK